MYQDVKTQRWVPEDGRGRATVADTFVLETTAATDASDGVDCHVEIRQVLRETDTPGIYTVRDQAGTLRWVRYDAVRHAFVRAHGQEDGAPVPAPCVPMQAIDVPEGPSAPRLGVGQHMTHTRVARAAAPAGAPAVDIPSADPLLAMPPEEAPCAP